MASNPSITASIAVLGGTGLVGGPIATVLLTEFRASFPTVRVFTRDPSSPKAQALAEKGAELVALDVATLEGALAGIDVVVNALPTDDRGPLSAAAARSGAKVYFPSEFGLDHRQMKFDGYNAAEWAGKVELAEEARALAAGRTKIVRLYVSIFLEIILDPGFGVDVQKNTFTPYGPASQRIGLTSVRDIGRAVARLALLALDPATAPSVPEEVRVAGSNLTFEDIRDTVARVKGVPPAEIQSQDLEAVKERLRGEGGAGDFYDYLRVAFGENWSDFTENDNELVNPGQKLWRWDTLEDHSLLRNEL